jgi:hypothetical protein
MFPTLGFSSVTAVKRGWAGDSVRVQQWMKALPLATLCATSTGSLVAISGCGGRGSTLIRFALPLTAKESVAVPVALVRMLVVARGLPAAVRGLVVPAAALLPSRLHARIL